MAKLKIIIDTDLGDDVDDVLAIALALRSPEIEILGITTVYKNTAMRSQLALELLDIFQVADIPVVTGMSQPIRGLVDSTGIPHQCRNLGRDGVVAEERHAVEFIIDTLKRHPDAILVGIGPLTNIGLAAYLAPDVMKNTRVVLMGGAFTAVYPEYNIMCDPEAANLLIESSATVEMIGLDVTTKCVLSDQDVEQIMNGSGRVGEFIGGLTKIWMETSIAKKVTLHDPLVIAYLVDPHLLQMKEEPIRIELDGTNTRGLTALCRTPFRQRAPFPKSVVKVAVSVDSQKMRDMLFDRVFG